MKVATFTVRATVEQSARWKRAAEAAGHVSAGTWLAEAADGYLRYRARAGRPLPLSWHLGRFRVLLLDGAAVDVRGMVSPPFAHFRGTSYGPDKGEQRTLVSLADGRVVATLKTARQARELAAELALVWLRDDQAAALTVARHEREAV